MSKVTGEVVPNIGGEKPFKAVIRHADGTLLAEEPCDSVVEGEALIVELLQSLRQIADDEGML
jgi:hypothetical protein